jgi:hypothetical protein
MSSFRTALLVTASTALSLAATPAALADPLTFTSKTSGYSGLASNSLLGVYTNCNNIYSATNNNGLSISTNGGGNWTTYKTTNGLGSNSLRGVYASGNNIYAATSAGVSISTNSASSWTNYTTSNTSGGLGNCTVTGIYAIGSNIYASIDGGGISVSRNNGSSWSNYTTTNGLGNNRVIGVYASDSKVYAATFGGGVSIASDPNQLPLNQVPGPLPLFGAVSAFGFSSKLRRRLRAAASVSPCC